MGEGKIRENSKFHKASRKPTNEEKRKMLSHAIQSGIEVVMRNHVYTFNGKIYHQVEEGPIALELTGAIARVFMLWWDRELLDECRNQ